MFSSHTIKTCMGKITHFSPSNLSFLTIEQRDEFNKIGYTGKDSNGNKNNYQNYLNSLDLGEFIYPIKENNKIFSFVDEFDC